MKLHCHARRGIARIIEERRDYHDSWYYYTFAIHAN